jgi:hypothetical protein
MGSNFKSHESPIFAAFKFSDGQKSFLKRRKMATAQLPIRLQSIVDLPPLGIGANSFKFGALTIESEKYVCIRDEGTDGNT